MKTSIKTVNISGKVSDMFGMCSNNGITYDGYVNVKALGSGDYLNFAVDNETGKIIGWIPLEPEDFECEE